MSMLQELKSVPNMLSALRLLMVPVFLVLLLNGEFVWSLIILAFASATDWLDGQIARRFNQITRLGQMLDPAADRLFIFATLIGLTINGNIPLCPTRSARSRPAPKVGIIATPKSKVASPPVHCRPARKICDPALRASTFTPLSAVVVMALADS